MATGQFMRDFFMNNLLNQDGVPLKDWQNSEAFKARLDSQFDKVFPPKVTKSAILSTVAPLFPIEWKG